MDITPTYGGYTVARLCQLTDDAPADPMSIGYGRRDNEFASFEQMDDYASAFYDAARVALPDLFTERERLRAMLIEYAEAQQDWLQRAQYLPYRDTDRDAADIRRIRATDAIYEMGLAMQERCE